MDGFILEQKTTTYLGISGSDEKRKEEVVKTVETSYLRFLKRMMYYHLFIIDDFENPEALDSEKFVDGIKTVHMYVRNHKIQNFSLVIDYQMEFESE